MTTTTPSPPPGPLGAPGTSDPQARGTHAAPLPPGSPGPGTSAPAPPPPGRRSISAWCVDRRWRTLLAAGAVIAGGILLVASGGIRTGADASGLVGDSAVAEELVEGADFGEVPTESPSETLVGILGFSSRGL